MVGSIPGIKSMMFDIAVLKFKLNNQLKKFIQILENCSYKNKSIIIHLILKAEFF